MFTKMPLKKKSLEFNELFPDMLENLTVVQLRDELKLRGLPYGKKKKVEMIKSLRTVLPSREISSKCETFDDAVCHNAEEEQAASGSENAGLDPLNIKSSPAPVALCTNGSPSEFLANYEQEKNDYEEDVFDLDDMEFEVVIEETETETYSNTNNENSNLVPAAVCLQSDTVIDGQLSSSANLLQEFCGSKNDDDDDDDEEEETETETSSNRPPNNGENSNSTHATLFLQNDAVTDGQSSSSSTNVLPEFCASKNDDEETETDTYGNTNRDEIFNSAHAEVFVQNDTVTDEHSSSSAVILQEFCATKNDDEETATDAYSNVPPNNGETSSSTHATVMLQNDIVTDGQSSSSANLLPEFSASKNNELIENSSSSPPNEINFVIDVCQTQTETDTYSKTNNDENFNSAPATVCSQKFTVTCGQLSSSVNWLPEFSASKNDQSIESSSSSPPNEINFISAPTTVCLQSDTVIDEQLSSSSTLLPVACASKNDESIQSSSSSRPNEINFVIDGGPTPQDNRNSYVQPRVSINEQRANNQRYRNSTYADDDFDMDEENFAKLDQPFDDNRVVLDPYNSDLNMKINADSRLVGESLSQEGFCFMLAGVRATHGFNRCKVGFEIKMLETIDVSDVKPEEVYPHEMRVGWSACESTLRLGESLHSYAYCNNGKRANSNVFTKIGDGFHVGDVVACLVDFDTMRIGFVVNGKMVKSIDEDLFQIDQRSLDALPTLFPHVCVKNVKFEVNFGLMETPWFGLPDGYTFVNDVPPNQQIKGSLAPSCKEDCTVLCMVGLPGSGKTTWIRYFLQTLSNRQWTILSTATILEQMKVQGEPRKKKHQGRWDMMMGAVVKCLNRLILLACRMRKNYILDATNVYPVPRRKKMVPFKDFKKKAVVVVPTVEDYANRCLQQMRHEGKQLPSDAMLEMKACFTLPKDDEGVFDEIEFVELQREDAQKVVEYFNEEGKSFKPREKKRRGDWQQEELPPKMQRVTAPTSGGSTLPTRIGPANHSHAPKFNSSYPYGVTPSLRPYAPTSTFTRQWTTPLGTGTIPKTNGVAAYHANNWAQMRTAAASFTPRSGWPANWPQASWNQPNAPANQQNPSPSPSSPFPPSTS